MLEVSGVREISEKPNKTNIESQETGQPVHSNCSVLQIEATGLGKQTGAEAEGCSCSFRKEKVSAAEGSQAEVQLRGTARRLQLSKVGRRHIHCM